MKIFTKTTVLLALLCLIFANFEPAYGCDRSDVTVDSITYSPGSTTIYATLCIGGGRTGASTQTSAGGDTRDIAFAFYSQETDFQVLNFAPDSIVGDSSGIFQTGLNYGPVSTAPFQSQGTIGYFDLTPSSAAYMCITTTALCGQVHTQCTQYTFTTNTLPDSIRVFGVEGGGNPSAGCMPNSDMLIDLSLLPVTWGSFGVQSSGYGNLLSWTTLSESNNDRFEVQRSSNGRQFAALSQLPGAGNSSVNRGYEYFDPSPVFGRNFYRIKQVDLDGDFSYSKVVSVRFEAESGLQTAVVSPNPTTGDLSIHFISEEGRPVNLSLYDMCGKQYYHGEQPTQKGANGFNLDLGAFPVGIYFLRIDDGREVVDKKVLLN